MKARMEGRCYYCTPCHKAIKVGDEIIPHPAVAGSWVHKWHLAPKAKKKESVQIPLFK